MEWHPVGYWAILLAFKWQNGPQEPDAPGITLLMRDEAATGCACRMSRLGISGLYQESPNRAIFLRGMDIVAKADAAASAKVRERLGMSLPDVVLPHTDASVVPIRKQDMRPRVPKHHVTLEILGTVALRRRFRYICGFADRQNKLLTATRRRQQTDKQMVTWDA
ncbi:hypothetical protein ACCQ14_10280 [Xanthomonas sp. NCPPB 2865]|uniref:hypothetical protein n=1 Tax=unclassified Xanthomonas TaxID=2643310 RepID=UPI001CF82C11|nr:hypothetical protein [Xanthomonas sp. MWU16-30325]